MSNNGVFKKGIAFLIFAAMMVLSIVLFSQEGERCRIPVFAVDKGGAPVLNLAKDDLELYVNGNRVKSIQLVKKPEGKVNFILFDAMFLSNYGVKRSRKIAYELIKNGSPGDSFVIMVNSARAGLTHVIGPNTNIDLILKELKKTRLFPGMEWFKDMFSTKLSSDDKSFASAHYGVDGQDTINVKTSEYMTGTFKNQYMMQIKKFPMTLVQAALAFRMISRPKVLYLFSEGFHEQDYEKIFGPLNRSDRERKVESVTFSGAVSKYFGKLIDTLKKSGSFVFVINPEKFKPVDQASPGTQRLIYLAGGKRFYFFGSRTNKIIESIGNINRSYFEINYDPGRNRTVESKIELKSKKENTYFFSPDDVGAEPYQRMGENKKKTFALTVVTEGILGRMVGNPKKIKYRKSVKSKKAGLVRYDIEIRVPEPIQNSDTDIFVIFQNKKTKKWGVTIKNKMVSKIEILSVMSRGNKVSDLYFALVNAKTGDSFYNQIK